MREVVRMFTKFPGDGHEEALLVLQELSTVLRCLATEIDLALSGEGHVDRERLGKIVRALNSSQETLVHLSRSSDNSGH